MKKGHLSQYFESVAVKRLSAVEADPGASNQHEFNGTRELKQVFGTGAGEKKQFPAFFIWLGEENEGISSDGFVTWYDARRKHPKRTEYRLYFPTTDVSHLAKEGDMMFIAKRTDGSVMIIITASGATAENQLFWLFGLEQPVGTLFEFTSIENRDDLEVDFVVRFILDELQIEPEEPEADLLDSLLEPFRGILPPTLNFSLFARQTVKDTSPLEDPDGTIMKWLDQEEKLFRRMERHIVAKRIEEGFDAKGYTDVDGFISFSLSVHNRRKSRAGHALEHHLEEIFKVHKIMYSRQTYTENKSRPDFLFPGSEQYHDKQFSNTLLTMLGVKTSLKDRWRQVLSEAARIENKHLFTLEPGISENQTAEMKSQRLQLVVPQNIHTTFTTEQISWLINLQQFIQILKNKQKEIFY